MVKSWEALVTSACRAALPNILFGLCSTSAITVFLLSACPCMASVLHTHSPLCPRWPLLPPFLPKSLLIFQASFEYDSLAAHLLVQSLYGCPCPALLPSPLLSLALCSGILI